MIAQIIAPVAGVLSQLQQLLESLSDEQYTRKVLLLSNASVGQHTRHIIEFFLELENGYATGYVNYDARRRDYDIETQRCCAIGKLLDIMRHLEKENKPLMLVTDFGIEDNSRCNVPTNYQRELVYNLEHSVHHMALLRIGVNAVSSIELPDSFGVAASTIKHKNVCVQ